MYKIIFYRDKRGRSETAEYLKELSRKNDKNSRLNLDKMIAYLNMLEKYGTRIEEPFTKNLTGDLWELRPFRNRIFYAYAEDNKFVVLHHFIKKTRKTPERELKKAIKNLKDYKERVMHHGRTDME